MATFRSPKPKLSVRFRAAVPINNVAGSTVLPATFDILVQEILIPGRQKMTTEQFPPNDSTAQQYNTGQYAQQPFQTQGFQNPLQVPAGAKSKIIAGILGLFFGTLGIHNFYVGRTTRGVIQLVGTILSFLLMAVLVGFLTYTAIATWAFIESILYLVGYGSYAYDGKGKPLV